MDIGVDNRLESTELQKDKGQHLKELQRTKYSINTN